MLFHQNKIYSSRDQSSRKKRFFSYSAIAIILILIIFVGPIRSVVSNTLAYIGKPAWLLRQKFYEKFPEQATYFTTKKRINRENRELKDRVRKLESLETINESLLIENTELKEIIGQRPSNQRRVFGQILSRVSDSPFDTLVINIGKSSGISVGDLVYSEGLIVLGKVQEVDISTSKVVLFSANNIRTDVLVGSERYLLSAVGEGGQNISIEFPADIDVNDGDLVFLDDVNNSIVARISKIDSTPGGLISVALSRSLANLNEIRGVEVSVSNN